MPTQLTDWVPLIFEFGPYAIWVIFALWIAPKLLRDFSKIEKSRREQRLIFGSITVGSWLVVAGLAVFITATWSIDKPYRGRLGFLEPTAKIYPGNEHLYFSTQGTQGDRETWSYALVADHREIQSLGPCFQFTVYWNENAEPNDYLVPTTLVTEEDAVDLKIRKLASGIAYFDPATRQWQDGQDCKAPPRQAGDLAIITSAQADEAKPADMAAIIQGLNSPNRVLQLKARQAMRDLETAELTQMLQLSQGQEHANKQIEKELARRQPVPN